MSACPAPLRDVGPQPDVWIPDSSAVVRLAQEALPRGPGPVLTSYGSVASAALAVGVPPATDRALDRLGIRPTDPWSRLWPALARLHVPLFRPDPTASATGLLHTAGLYLGYRGTMADVPALSAAGLRGLERGTDSAGTPAGDEQHLLCGLLRPGAGSSPGAYLVSLRAPIRLPTELGDCPTDDYAPGPVPRPAVRRPAGAPVLDYPFVAVSWPGARAPERDAAIQRFRAFLLTGGGRKALHDAGYGPPSSAVDALPGGVTLAQARTVLTAYEHAREPVSVLFLVDESGSMARDGRLTDAVQAVRQSLGGLRGADSYGVWAIPGG